MAIRGIACNLSAYKIYFGWTSYLIIQGVYFVSVDQLAKLVWDYHHLHHELKQSAAILVLCSNDVRVAEHAADLFLAGWAPLLIFSGGVGELTRGLFDCSEAEHFAKIAIERGVPESQILIEPNSTNTGENILFTQQLLQEKQLDPDTFIVVQKPFMERRSYATFKKRWPEKDLIISSPDISFEEYSNDFGTVMVVSYDGKDLKKSEKVLLQVGMQCRPTDWKTEPTMIKVKGADPVPGKKILNYGKAP